MARPVESWSSPQITGSRVIAGTPMYMAPERLSATADVDARVDIYSWGATAYYLLTGQEIFEADGSALIIHIINDLPDRPSTLMASPIPADIDQLLLRCLAKDPADRPQDIREVLNVLDNLAGVTEWTAEERRQWWLSNEVDAASPAI